MKDEHDKYVLAIDNRYVCLVGLLQKLRRIVNYFRRFFFNFQFFAIFANIALGFVSACIRILNGAVFGIISIARLDVSTISRQFEQFDAGIVTIDLQFT